MRKRLDAWRLAIVLVLIVLATSMLGYWAWQGAVRHHAVSVLLLRSQAQLAAQQFSSQVVNELYVAATAALRPAAGGRFGGGGRREAPVDPRVLLDSIPALERCQCVPVLVPAFAFRTDLTDGGTVLAGPAASRSDVPWLVDVVRRHLTSVQGGWDVAIVPGDRRMAGRTIFVTRRRGAGGGTIFGIAVDSATLRREIFRPVLRDARLATDAPKKGPPSDSMVALRVIDRAGVTLFATSAAPDSTYAAETQLRPEWGFLAVRTSVRQAAARRILAGGLPSSPTPMLIALLLMAAAMLAAATALLWRTVELARLRSDFTSSVSHELRTPLTQILLYAEALQMGHHRSREERARALDVVTREARRLIHMVENILHFSRAERRLVRVSPAPQRLASLASEVIEAFAPIAAARGVQVDLDPSGNPTANVDGDAFRRMLLNLLDNAVRYGPPGQRVTVAVERAGVVARVTVEDEGPGVPPEARERIWAPFVRLEMASDDPNTGGGIGLAIVRELAELHGGAARMEPAPGGGSRFVIELGLVDDIVPDARPVDASLEPVAPR